MGELQHQLMAMPEANIMLFAPPTLPGLGSAAGFDLRILAQAGQTPAELEQVTRAILMKANQPFCFVPVFEQYHRRDRHDSVFSGNVLAVVYHKLGYLYLAYAVKYQLVYYRGLRCACTSPTAASA